jgi:hypothetical protein
MAKAESLAAPARGHQKLHRGGGSGSAFNQTVESEVHADLAPGIADRFPEMPAG